MRLRRRVHLAIVGAAISCAGGCASHSGSAPASAGHAPLPARAIAFESAAPLELERGSYGASRRDHYNRIYSRPESERPEPNEFLVECLDRIDALKRREAEAPSQPIEDVTPMALDMGMGDGRNTIVLAQRGYHTVGFDMADIGVNRARRRAAEMGLTIDARVDLFGDRYLEPNHWDLVVKVYFDVDHNDLERIKQSVKTGGHIIIEFPGHYPNNDSLRDFLDWQIIVYEMDWGTRQWERANPVTSPGMRTRLLVRRLPS